MNKSSNYLNRLWNFFRFPKKELPIQGSQYPLGIASTLRIRQNLDIPEQPIRPIIDIATSRQLIEMRWWSYEVRHALSFLSHDCFQQQDGSSGSWRLTEELQDGTPVHPDTLAIGRNLQNRISNKESVLGGDRLQRAARDMLAYGDSFLELGIEKDGLGGWGIAKSLYLPSLSVFVEESNQGETLRYRQQASFVQSDSDILIEASKMLHFSYEKDIRYGEPITLQSLPKWQEVNSAAMALAKAARDCGIAPWLHIMSDGATPKSVDTYREKHQQALQEGIITNLYLSHGAEVRKAAVDSNAIAPLAEYFLACRRQMIPPCIPLWMYPDLGHEATGLANDIAGQPAMAYSRTISNLRSLLGNQIKWAVSLEICLIKGFDWFLQYGQFEIIWGDWFATPGQLVAQQQQND
jgi:hypothetical protein